MSLKQRATVLVGIVLTSLKEPSAHNERGLSQSAETAIIVAGAIAIALVVVALIRAFVVSELGRT